MICDLGDLLESSRGLVWEGDRTRAFIIAVVKWWLQHTRSSDADLTTMDGVLATYAAEREWKPCKDDLRELTSI